MSDTLDKLQQANPELGIESVSAATFGEYGRVLEFYDPGEMIARAEEMLPESDGVVYEPSVAALEEPSELNQTITRQVYGGMPMQVGWCYGRNLQMGALEYHKGTEVLVCLTDVVLLVGRLQDVVYGYQITYDTANVAAYYAPEGSVIEFHPWCLHFAPIHVREGGRFATLVYLPRGTNEELPFEVDTIGESRLLFGVNKWLIAHPDAGDLVQDGAYVGIIGDDILITPAS